MIFIVQKGTLVKVFDYGGSHVRDLALYNQNAETYLFAASEDGSLHMYDMKVSLYFHPIIIWIY